MGHCVPFGKGMKISAYILNWNEEDCIELTINYYAQFCESITILDNHSTDESTKIAEKLCCKVVQFGIKGVLDDFEYLKIKENCWKGSDCDFVIVCDMDEIVYEKNIVQFLNNAKKDGVTLVRGLGFNMFSEKMPEKSWLEIETGQHYFMQNKVLVFDPKKIEKINYSPGAHACNPKGFVKFSRDWISVLHYHWVGGLDRIKKRYKDRAQRMSQNNKKNRFGYQYLFTEEEIEKNYKLWADPEKITKIIQK